MVAPNDSPPEQRKCPGGSTPGTLGNGLIANVSVPRGVDDALTIADHGYRVFRVSLQPQADGTYKKVPHNWAATATRDPAKIRRMWSGRNAGSFIGYCTGDGVVGVDVDNKHGKAGQAWWETQGFDLGYTYPTLSGGWHCLAQTDTKIGCPQLWATHGIDIKGEGGWLFAHAIPPRKSELPRLPGPLEDTLRPPEPRERRSTNATVRDPALGLHPYAQRAIGYELDRLDECARGGDMWDNTVYSVACNLIEFANSPWSGYSLEQAHADWLNHAPTDNSGFPESRRNAKWDSAVATVGDGDREEPEDDWSTTTPQDVFGMWTDETPTREKPVMKARCAADMPIPVPPRWIAVGHIPRAEITILTGNEGIGKSLFWVWLVAAITTGQPLPHVGLPGRDPRDVVIIITEDSWSEVRERLALAGADLARVHVFSEEEDGSGAPTFPADMKRLRHEAAGLDLALVVVDGWLDTVPGNFQVKDPQQARSALHPWKEFATGADCAVMLLAHTNRITDGSIRDMVGATGALRQKARMLLFAAAREEEVGSRLYIGPEKANTTGLSNATVFTIEVKQVRTATDDDPGTAARLVDPQKTDRWLEKHLSDWRAEKREAERKPTKVEEAVAWLRTYMAANHGEVLASEAKAAVKASGLRLEVVMEALHKLGGRSASKAVRGPWYWTVPVADSNVSPTTTVTNEIGNIEVIGKDRQT